MSPEEASAAAFMKELRDGALPPALQAELMRDFFEQRIVTSPSWRQTPPEQQMQVAQSFQVMDYKPMAMQGPAAGPQGDPARETKRALAPLMPGFTASDMSSVFQNPQATYGDKAKAALGYLSHYPDLVTKAIAPPAFWKMHDPEAGPIGKAFDFLPFGQAYQVMGGIGSDVGAGLAGGRGGYGEMAGGLIGGMAINPMTARRLGPWLDRQTSSPMLQKILERFRGRGSGGAPPTGAPGGTPSPMTPPSSAGMPGETPRPRYRYGPEGVADITP